MKEWASWGSAVVGGVLAFVTGFTAYWPLYLTAAYGWPVLVVLGLMGLSSLLLSVRFGGSRGLVLMLAIGALGVVALVLFFLLTSLEPISDG